MSTGVNIPITATVNAAQLGALNGSLASLRAQLKQAKADYENAAPNSASFRVAAAEVRRLEQELGRAERSATKAAGKKGAGGAGQGMLMLGQALEDAQYGLRGVMNNIPGLVTSLGLGAGAAGVLQIGLVAVSQIMDLISEQAKANNGKPLLGEMTFDERIMREMDLFSEALERQRDAAKERNEALRDTVDAVNAAVDAEREMIKLRREMEDEDFVSTGDPVRDIVLKKDMALNRVDEDAALRAKERETKLQAARAEQAAREQEAAQLAAEAQAQAEKVAGLKQRAAVEAALEAAKSPDMIASANAGDTSGSLREWAVSGLLDKLPGLKDLFTGRKAISGEQIASLQERLKGLPGLEGFEPTGKADEDEKRRRDLFAQELQKQDQLKRMREEAERDAASGRRKLGTVEAATEGERTLDEVKTARERQRIQDRAEAETERQFAAERQQSEATQDVTQPVPADAAMKGLRNLAGSTNDPTAKAGLGALNSALSDGQGDTGREAEIVQQMLAKIGTDRTQNMAAIQQALREMESIQTEGSQMQQRMASAFAAISSAYRSMRNDLDGVIAEFQSYRDSNRR